MPQKKKINIDNTFCYVYVDFMQRTNACAKSGMCKICAEEGTVEGSFNCNVYSIVGQKGY